ncbi:MAG TPA: hydrogenase maturation protease [Verrucomicrobiae bacterium]|nr:hydrogenase maturation protease [Verrucomicrobiae bacterium]
MNADETKILVIGYGNTLRRDDGVGVKIAEAVAAMDLPGVTVITRHQLAPELAVPISEADAVVFVDAEVKASEPIKLRMIKPAETVGRILAHAADPRSLLALAKEVFGRNPIAWTLGVPVEDFNFGDGFSSRAEKGFQDALKQIRGLIQNKFCETVANAG